MGSVFQFLLCEHSRKFRALEVNGVTSVNCLEQQCISHAVIVGLIRCIGLIKLRLPLAADAIFRTSQNTQGSVSGTIDKNLTIDDPHRLSGLLICLNPADLVTLHLTIFHDRVQIRSQVRLLLHCAEQHHIPYRKVIIIISALVFQHHLVKDAALFQVRLLHALRSAADVHSDLAGRISAKYMTAMDQCRLSSVSGSRNRCTHTGKPAAYYYYFIRGIFFLHSI